MSSRAALFAVVGLTVVASALRLAAFGESFYGDELFTYEVATRPGITDVLDGVRSNLEITPPLYFVVAWVFQKLGDPFVWLRAPSLVAGVATVPLVYVLGVRTVGRQAAIVATGLFALSPIATFYATEARAYSLMTLLTVLSTLTLLRALEVNTWAWWALFALVTAGAAYSHYTSILVLGTQAVWALVAHRERAHRLLVAHIGAAMLYLPWIPSLLDDRNAPAQRAISKLDPFTAESLIRNVGRLAAGRPVGRLVDLPGVPAMTMLGVGSAIALGGLIVRAVAGRPRLSASMSLVVALACAAPVGTALYSMVGDDLFVPRNMLSSLPALTLVIAALLTALPRTVAALALALVFAALALGAAGSIEAQNRRPAYASAASFVEARAALGDVVVEFNPLPEPPRRAFLVQLDPSLPLYRFSQEAKAMDAAASSGGRIFYVRTQVGASKLLVPAQVERSYLAVEQRTWEGLQDVTVVVYEPR